MVNDFLKKYQEELISEKIQLKEDMDLLETKIKEENKFLNLLEESNESYFKEFTPRDLNKKNNEKADEIRSILVDLQAEFDNKTQKMKFYDGRLVEINALLSNTAVINRPSSDSKPSEESSSIAENISNDDLVYRLSNIKDMILLDPYRAQIELDNIISII